MNIWRSHACPSADWLFKLTTTNEKTINNNDLMLEAIMVQFCRRKLITKKETLDSHRPTWYRASKNVARNRLNHMQYLLVNKNKRHHLPPQGLPKPPNLSLLPLQNSNPLAYSSQLTLSVVANQSYPVTFWITHLPCRATFHLFFWVSRRVKLPDGLTKPEIWRAYRFN